MSMISCPECGKEISDLAQACPNCGFPIGFESQSIPNEEQNYDKRTDNPYHNNEQRYNMCEIEEEKSAIYALGVVALILSIIPITAIFGIAISIVCILRNNGRKKVLPIVALTVGILWFVLFMSAGNNSDSEQGTTQTIDETEQVESNGEKEYENNMEEEVIVEESKSDLENNDDEYVNLSTDKEIIFRDIPWGTSFSDVDEILGDMNLMNISGEDFQTKSIDDIILGDYKGLDFEYTDINIIASAMNNEIEVAGYTTNGIDLYFSYVPNNEVLNKTEEESALYGAKYTFGTTNINQMSEDLKNKLKATYGEPVKESTDSDIWGNEYEYVFWRGSNDTELVLKTCDAPDDSDLYEDEIEISYVWFEGDKMLQMASDTLKQEAINKEKETYGNGSTNGL